MLHRSFACSPLGRLPCAALFETALWSTAPSTAAGLRSLSCGPAGCPESSSLPSPPPPPPPPLVEPWRDAAEPIERAATPPSSWYTSPAVLQLEDRTVFRHSWLAVARSSQLAAPGAYAAGSLLGLQWLACRDERGQLRAFHNVCRHHAAILAPPGTGSTDCFRCGYHGWTYGLDGRLQRATRLAGIQGFRAAEHGLRALQAEEWGGFVWVRQGPAGSAGRDQQPRHAQAEGAQQQVGQRQQEEEEEQQQQHSGRSGVAAWLGPRGSAAALAAGMADPLVHVASREYELRCNWKVFVDNYLDGGYHVSVAHPELAAGLDLPSYRSTIYERLSIQSCQPAGAQQEGQAGQVPAVPAAGERPAGGEQRRLGGGRPPAYIFVYPNLMINRYGPWLDVNTVIPLAADRCKVLFDYYLDASLASDQPFIAHSLAASDRVQQEDTGLCESVQRGLASPSYDVGRYAPGVEGPMFHFHQLLDVDLMAGAAAGAAPA
ncbi:hypothetical protein ABPG75_000776 [Micractinium tetrahymenae]